MSVVERRSDATCKNCAMYIPDESVCLVGNKGMNITHRYPNESCKYFEIKEKG